MFSTNIHSTCWSLCRANGGTYAEQLVLLVTNVVLPMLLYCLCRANLNASTKGDACAEQMWCLCRVMSVASEKYGGAYISLQILCKCGSAHTEQI